MAIDKDKTGLEKETKVPNKNSLILEEIVTTTDAIHDESIQTK
jgi:hypothetical protein